MLFQLDLREQSVDEAIAALRDSLLAEDEETARGPDPFMEELVRGVAGRKAEIDAIIAGHSEHWRLQRMPAVDRNILRLAVCEMTMTATPPAVAIDEALELARRFAGEESVAFINGVLDAVRREI